MILRIHIKPHKTPTHTDRIAIKLTSHYWFTKFESLEKEKTWLISRMPIQRRHFEQLATPESWHSPVAVIAHIDLDAFYAQCLGVHYGVDPTEPLGCRQWNALIAINYPARKYGLKRGVSIDEARKLCPGIHLPHVATFKKGDLHWDFHDKPEPNGYKVSLDHFRRESRKIFSVFKENFRLVEKAGIDEGFIDMGPEVYREALERYPELQVKPDSSEELQLSHDDLLNIGAELVNSVRLQIHERLHYTCSAGIAANKQLAKLGSGYNKPFNQTVVHTTLVGEFLANFKITDAWGWGGKTGKFVVEALEIPEDIDQCKYVRENFSLIDLQHKIKGDVILARKLYEMVRGENSSEVTPRTLIKSMAAVKDFRRLNHLEKREDVDSWLRVFSADLSGRLADLQDDLGSAVAPKTITVKQHKGGLQSKQQPLSFTGTEISQFREQIYQQSSAISKTFVILPCTYLVVEVSHIAELPKERLIFQSRKSNPELSRSNIGEAPTNDEEEDLFVKDQDEYDENKCSRCGKYLKKESIQEHQDWHFAKDLQKQDYITSSGNNNSIKTPPEKKGKVSRSAPASPQGKKKPKKDPQNQKSILEFFK